MTDRGLCVWVALVPLAVAGSLSLIKTSQLVAAPYELGYGEGLVLWQALHVTHPSTVYHPISSFPFVVGMYPPLFMMVIRLLNGAVHDIQLAGRLTTVVSFAGVLGAVAALVHLASGPWIEGTARRVGMLVAVLLAVSVSSTRLFLPSARVDGLGLGLTLAGLALFLGARGSTRKEWIALVLFVAAAFTKQTFIAAPLACVIVTALTDMRKAARLVGAAILIGLVPLAWLSYVTKGQILVHLFVYTQNRFSVPRLVALLTGNVREMLPLIGIAATVPYVFWRLSTRKGGSADESGADVGSLAQARLVSIGLSIYLLLALAISVTCGKIGSAPYYFMEWNVACCVLAGCGFGLLVDRSSLESMKPATILASVMLAGFGAVAATETANQALRLTSGSRSLQAARLDETRRVLDLVNHTPGPIFSDDLTILVQAGRQVSVEPFIMFELTRGGQWDPAAFLDQIRRRYYVLLILQRDLDLSSTDQGMPELVRGAMKESYRLSMSIGDYRIYAPL